MTSTHAPLKIMFFDANVLISAAWKDGCEVAQIWQMEGVPFITSNYVMGEVQRNLLQVSQIERLRGLMRSVQIVSFDKLPENPEVLVVPEKDRPVLGGAIQAQAIIWFQVTKSTLVLCMEKLFVVYGSRRLLNC